MKIKVNKTESQEVYPGELCDEYEKEDGIICKSYESSALVSEKEVIINQLRKTLLKILRAPYVDEETKNFILQDEDLFPLIEKQWNTYKRFNEPKENPLVIKNGRIYISEFK